jgi:hypothetical protein
VFVIGLPLNYDSVYMFLRWNDHASVHITVLPRKEKMIHWAAEKRYK